MISIKQKQKLTPDVLDRQDKHYQIRGDYKTRQDVLQIPDVDASISRDFEEGLVEISSDGYAVKDD